MYNIIHIFLLDFLKNLFGDGSFIDSWLDTTFENMSHRTFYIEDNAAFMDGVHVNFETLMAYVLGFAITLIILKYIYKGAKAYLSWTDDPNADPIVMATNFVKALVIALSFPLLYSWLCEIVEDFTNGLFKALSIENTMNFVDALDAMLMDAGLPLIIFLLIFVVLYIILYIKLLIRAAELFVIRVGFPLACVGMIDANGGIFTGYLNKMYQTVLSVVVQIVLAKLSLLLMTSDHLGFAIAFAILSIKSPQVLRDLIYTPQGGGGLSTAYYGTMMTRMLLRR